MLMHCMNVKQNVIKIKKIVKRLRLFTGIGALSNKNKKEDEALLLSFKLATFPMGSMVVRV